MFQRLPVSHRLKMKKRVLIQLNIFCEQVSPTELEGIILEIPGVADAAVVGIPDALTDELPRAFVVRRPDSPNLTEAEVEQYVAHKVASYKKLAGGVKFIDVIPRNAAGKVLRHQLKVFGEKSPTQ